MFVVFYHNIACRNVHWLQDAEYMRLAMRQNSKLLTLIHWCAIFPRPLLESNPFFLIRKKKLNLTTCNVSVHFILLILIVRAIVSCRFSQVHIDCGLCMLPSQMAVQRWFVCYMDAISCVFMWLFILEKWSNHRTWRKHGCPRLKKTKKTNKDNLIYVAVFSIEYQCEYIAVCFYHS